MKIIKSGGVEALFDIERVKRSIRRTRASEAVVERVAREVEARIQNGMTTQEIYHLVFELLRKEKTCYACRYDLREAVLRMGPAGFNFEKYVASILRAHGYNAYVPENDLLGACVTHEVDGIAKKDGRTIVIEAKFRNNYHDRVHIQSVLSTWARYLDLLEGAGQGTVERFDEVWIVTNAKFTSHAMQFGMCKGIRMIGWDVPGKNSFAEMVDVRALYPITVLYGLTEQELQGFAQVGWMLCKEVLEHEPEEIARRVGMSVKRAEEILNLSEQVVGDEINDFNQQKTTATAVVKK